MREVEAVPADLQVKHDNHRLQQALEVKLDLRQLPGEGGEERRVRGEGVGVGGKVSR